MFEAGAVYQSAYGMQIDGTVTTTFYDSLVFYDAPSASPHQQVGVGNLSDDRVLNVLVDHGGRITWDETSLGTGKVEVEGNAYFQPDGQDGFDGTWEAHLNDDSEAHGGPWKLTKVSPTAGAVAMAG